MRKGYAVNKAWSCGFGDSVLVVSNLTVSNEVVIYPFVSYDILNRISTDIGMWKVKQLNK